MGHTHHAISMAMNVCERSSPLFSLATLFTCFSCLDMVGYLFIYCKITSTIPIVLVLMRLSSTFNVKNVEYRFVVSSVTVVCKIRVESEERTSFTFLLGFRVFCDTAVDDATRDRNPPIFSRRSRAPRVHDQMGKMSD